MRARRPGIDAVALAALVTLVIGATSADARTVRGLVYEDTNGDGRPSIGEPGVAGAVVAYEVQRFAVTNTRGEYTLEAPGRAGGIVWVRVPDGYVPGPRWARVDDEGRADVALQRTAGSLAGPLRFVVTADTHVTIRQPFWADLGDVALAATATDPAPAFFTILGDITQGNQDAQFDLVDDALANLGVPYVPVPGNHDWYDDGETWFRRYGPDNYSFDVAGVHVVVWNMAMTDDEITRYLGAELVHVAPEMPIVALSHAPPSPAVIAALRRLGVDYVLTGHTHSNRVVDHGGLLELTTEPLMMGGLDLTPAGYRIVTIDRGAVGVAHRTVVDTPWLEILSPADDHCAAIDATPPPDLVVAAELDAGTTTVTARFDRGPPIALRSEGGWAWSTALPSLPRGPHAVVVTARSTSGEVATRSRSFDACAAERAPPAGRGWPQLGGAADHRGATAHELAPPLTTRWVTPVGGHVVGGSPVIAGDTAYVAVTDLAAGDGGGVVALDLRTGARRWRTATPRQVRGAPTVVGETVVVAQVDGVVLGLDATTGELGWRHALGGDDPRTSATLSGPTADDGDVVIGNQRTLAAISARDGRAWWTRRVVDGEVDFSSLSAVAIGEGVVVGTFARELSGVIAWDRVTGARQWHVDDEASLAIHAAPVISDGTVYLVNSATEVVALDALTGERRWRTQLDPAGHDWGMAAVAAPAVAHDVVVIATMWRDLVGLDAATGRVRWQVAASPGPLRTTHYRGRGEAGFAGAPVITGDLVWAVDTAGELTALALETGERLWQADLGGPVLAGLATSGDWLVVASYDGTVRALAPTRRGLAVAALPDRDPVAHGCCETTTTGGAAPAMVVVLAYAAVGRRRRRRRRRATAATTTGHAPVPAPPVLHA